MLRRRSIIAVALLGLALSAPSAAVADDCAGADAVPTADSLAAAGQATLCLLNEQRAASGLPALRENAALSAAAAQYSRRMVAEGFFAHVSPDGGTLVSRLTAAGYLRDAEDWAAGENIGWGQAVLATPRSMVAAWMRSRGHRENILSVDYAEVGLGVVIGTPVDRSWGATYTTELGRRGAAARAAGQRLTAASRQSGAGKRRTCARSTQARKRGAKRTCARASRARRR